MSTTEIEALTEHDERNTRSATALYHDLRKALGVVGLGAIAESYDQLVVDMAYFLADHGALATADMDMEELLHLEHARAYGSFDGDPPSLRYGMMQAALQDIAKGKIMRSAFLGKVPPAHDGPDDPHAGKPIPTRHVEGEDGPKCPADESGMLSPVNRRGAWYIERTQPGNTGAYWQLGLIPRDTEGSYRSQSKVLPMDEEAAQAVAEAINDNFLRWHAAKKKREAPKARRR